MVYQMAAEGGGGGGAVAVCINSREAWQGGRANPVGRLSFSYFSLPFKEK
ncbi:MAG: hypothetical protein ABWY34_05305 [Pseudoxanthomonas sp.]